MWPIVGVFICYLIRNAQRLVSISLVLNPAVGESEQHGCSDQKTTVHNQGILARAASWD